MAKYHIIEKWDGGKYMWSAYQISSWWKAFRGLPKRYICLSIKSAEDCETKLREHLNPKPPKVVKELEI